MNNRVLVVDDSLYMRARIKDTLKNAGFEIVGEAENGEKAIDLAMTLKPDIITLDNILPDMIGIDILRVLKSEELLDVRIIMISAVGQESVIQEGLAIGAEDYIVKPFTNEVLVEKLNMIRDRQLH